MPDANDHSGWISNLRDTNAQQEENAPSENGAEEQAAALVQDALSKLPEESHEQFGYFLLAGLKTAKSVEDLVARAVSAVESGKAKALAAAESITNLGRWVTVGAKKGAGEDDEEGGGGRRMYIDDAGRVEKGGPPGMQGKPIDDKAAWSAASSSKPKSSSGSSLDDFADGYRQVLQSEGQEAAKNHLAEQTDALKQRLEGMSKGELKQFAKDNSVSIVGDNSARAIRHSIMVGAETRAMDAFYASDHAPSPSLEGRQSQAVDPPQAPDSSPSVEPPPAQNATQAEPPTQEAFDKKARTWGQRFEAFMTSPITSRIMGAVVVAAPFIVTGNIPAAILGGWIGNEIGAAELDYHERVMAAIDEPDEPDTPKADGLSAWLDMIHLAAEDEGPSEIDKEAATSAAESMAQDMESMDETQQQSYVGFLLARIINGDTFEDARDVALSMISDGETAEELEPEEDDEEEEPEEYDPANLSSWFDMVRLFDPNQPRASNGRWTKGAGGGGKKSKTKAEKPKAKTEGKKASADAAPSRRERIAERPALNENAHGRQERSADVQDPALDPGAQDSVGRFRPDDIADSDATNPALKQSFAAQSMALKSTFEKIAAKPWIGGVAGFVAGAVGVAAALGGPQILATIPGALIGIIGTAAGGAVGGFTFAGLHDAIGSIWEKTEDYLSDQPGRRAANPRVRKVTGAPLLSAWYGELEEGPLVCLNFSAFGQPALGATVAAPYHVYDWEPHPEGLLVKDVEVMSYLDPAERTDLNLPVVVDDAFFAQMLSLSGMQEAKGKFARLLYRHNSKQEAPVIGRLMRPRWQQPWVVADCLFTNPDAIGMAARGELPSRSAEFKAATRHLWGLAFTAGTEGHFDEELPDFRLAEKPGIERYRALGHGGLSRLAATA